MLLQELKVLLPAYSRPQEESLAWLAEAHARAEATSAGCGRSPAEWLPHMARLVRRYGCSADHIGWRHSELEDFMHTEWRRMQIFNLEEQASGRGMKYRTKFFEETANSSLERLLGGETDPPTDLLHVTCTGYCSPSAIQRLIQQKQWHTYTRATHVYHMGCYAAIPALRIAAGLLKTWRNGIPLRAHIVHTELCTLHFDPRDHSPEQLVVQSLFADGHAGYTMVPEDAKCASPAFEVLAVREESIPDSLDDMTWVLSEYGFRMTLSRKVPARIAAFLPGFLQRLFSGAGEKAAAHSRCIYALHPGGPRIIDSIQELLHLDDGQVASSRAVLYRNGNLSSATLPHVWTHTNGSYEIACAMDFLEHVENPAQVIAEAARVLFPGGLFFFHTFNRNLISWLIVIKGVEWFVDNTPPGMHRLTYFIKPSELRAMCGQSGLRIAALRGLAPRVCARGFWRMIPTGRVGDDFAFCFKRLPLTGYAGVAVKQCIRQDGNVDSAAFSGVMPAQDQHRLSPCRSAHRAPSGTPGRSPGSRMSRRSTP